MNFTQLYDEVLLIVKRPDLSARIESAIKASTLKMHHSDFFYKDIFETAVIFDDVANLQSFTPSEILPNFRKAKYIRFWHESNTGAMPGAFLRNIQIEDSLDGYNTLKENVFYMAGKQLQIRACPGVKHVLFGAYMHPVVTPVADYNSWIAEEYPYAIIYDAARTVFQSIGFAEQANNFALLSAEVLGEIKMSSVDDIPLT